MNNTFKVAATILNNSAESLSGHESEQCEREVLNKAGGKTNVKTDVWSVTSDNPEELATQLRIAAELMQTDGLLQIITTTSNQEEYSVICNEGEVIIAPSSEMLKEQVAQVKAEQPDTAVQEAERAPLKVAGAGLGL